MEPMKLKVDTGAVTVEVEDERGERIGQFQLNPADSNILKRYGAVVDFFNGMKPEEGADGEEQIEAMNRLADSVAEQFDFLLGYPVSGELFSRCGPLTVTKNGDFFFEQVLSGVGKLIESVTKKRLDKKMARIRRAVANAPGMGK